ncbi:MAG TPA: trimeric intracellular cation channel family protein [Alphaproteobacteria bacterium]
MNQILLWLDIIGITVFAMTGCLVAARKHLDVISFILLGTVTGMGGGTLRDVLLDRAVFWVQQPKYLVICTVTSIIMFFIASHIDKYRRWILWGDAIGISVFTVVGTNIALEMGMHWSVCILMGVATCIVGGIVRDLLANEPSLIVRKEIYATACVAGSAMFIVAHSQAPELAIVLSMGTTFLIRAAAIHYRLQLPGYAWKNEPFCEYRRRRNEA